MLIPPSWDSQSEINPSPEVFSDILSHLYGSLIQVLQKPVSLNTGILKATLIPPSLDSQSKLNLSCEGFFDNFSHTDGSFVQVQRNLHPPIKGLSRQL